MSLRSWMLLLGLSCCWGSSFLMIDVALEGFSPVEIAFLRIFFGALFLWVIVVARGLKVPRNLRLLCGMGVGGVLITALPFTLIAWGQQQIDSGLAAVLNATTAIFGTLLAALLFKDERLTLAKALGVATGFCGVVIIIGIESLQHLDISSLAQYAVLAAAISYAFGGASGKMLVREGSPVVHAAGMTTCGALLLLPFVLLQPQSLETGLQNFSVIALHSTAAILWLGIVSTAVAYLFYYSLLRAAGVANLLLCTLIIAPIAIALGAIFLDEVLTLQVWGGFALIAFGLVLIDARLPTWVLRTALRKYLNISKPSKGSKGSKARDAQAR